MKVSKWTLTIMTFLKPFRNDKLHNSEYAWIYYAFMWYLCDPITDILEWIV